MDDDDGATIVRIHPEIPEGIDIPTGAVDVIRTPPSGWGALMPELFNDPDIDPDEIRSELRFCEIILQGTPRLDAAIEVNWSLTYLRHKLSEPGFIELLEAVEQHKNQVIEEALYQKARYGNMDAIKMWLFNRYPERWRDVRRIEIDQHAEVSVTVAASVRAGVLELIRNGHTKDLQPGGVLDAKVVREVGSASS